MLQLLARNTCWLVHNLRPGDYPPTYPPKLGSDLPKLGSFYLAYTYLCNDPPPPTARGRAPPEAGPLPGPTVSPGRRLSLRQLRAHALALRLQHSEALCGRRQRRKVELLRLEQPRRHALPRRVRRERGKS